MKKRRIAIIAFILAAVLTISVGYAALTRDLKVEGKAKSTPDNLNVVFSASELVLAETTDGAEASSAVGAPGDFAISMTAANLVKIGDKVVAKYTIKNNNEYDVTLAEPTISETGHSDYFEVSTDWGTGTFLLEAGRTKDVIVTVELVDSSADPLACDFVITINASAGT
ncbi:MAG: hypothetical protein E7667_00200 [Ruminococcaceae bacterium]|nr:hypothetical protein [Oscillospiraceae bacterium]